MNKITFLSFVHQEIKCAKLRLVWVVKQCLTRMQGTLDVSSCEETVHMPE